MKTLKRTLAIAVAILMLAMMCAVSVSADPVATVTLKNSNESITMLGHTYKAYKIFDVTFSADHSSYNYTVDPQFENLAGADYATIEALDSNSPALFDFAEAAAAYIATNSVAADATVTVTAQNLVVSGNEQSVTLPLSEYGYYLIYDVYNDALYAGEYDVVSALLLTTVDSNKDVSIKADLPTVTKVITGVGNSAATPVSNIETNAVDATIGDHIWFRLGSSVPNTIGYEKYVFKFNDTLSAGLTYDNNAKVYYNGSELGAAYYTVSYESGELTVKIDSDVIMGVGSFLGSYNKPITVVYSATLNSDAVIYDGTDPDAYNPNEVYLTYSNNPLNSGTGIAPGDETTPGEPTDSTGDTPPAEVKVYTFEVSVFKYTTSNNQNVGLGGAIFTLQDSNGAYIPVTADATVSGVYEVTPGVTGTAANSRVTSPANGSIKVSGLEAGTYTLIEVEAPNGYSRLVGAANPVITVVYANGAVSSYSSPTVNILNSPQGVLPTTGGVGTVIFTVVGIVLMVGAAVVFIIRKKHSKFN